MKIAIACDHIVTDRKIHMIDYLKGKGYDVVDCGTCDHIRTHYPIYGKKLAETVVSGEADLGITICGTGVGITTAAAKVPGARTALVRDAATAEYVKKHLDANIIGMGGRITGVGLMEYIVDRFIETKAEPDEKDKEIIEKINALAQRKDDQYRNVHFFDKFIDRWEQGYYHD